MTLHRADHQALIRLLGYFLDTFEDTMTEEEKDQFAQTLLLITMRSVKR